MIMMNYYVQICVDPGIVIFPLASSDLMYRLAPWIMLLIVLWGIGRLFRRSSDDEISDADNEPDWYRQQDSNDADGEYDDDYDEED